MTPEEKAARDAALALILSRMNPAKLGRIQSAMLAWQFYKAAREAAKETQRGGGKVEE